jgi:hypothetical protein
MLTYALGRGLDYHDTDAVDQIVERLEKNHGQPSALLTGIIDSAPFQRRQRSQPNQPMNRTDQAIRQANDQPTPGSIHETKSQLGGVNGF